MFISHWLKIRLRGLVPARGINFLFGFVLLCLLFLAMFNFIAGKGLSAFDFSLVLLSFTLLLLLPLVYYSALVTSLSFLFQKEEIQFYFSLPVSRTAVFAVKLLETYVTSGWMVFLALCAFLTAAQVYFRLPALIYLAGALSLLVFLFIPVALAALTVLLISRIFPIIRARGILIVIGLLTGSSLVASIRFMQPEKLASPEGKLRLVTFIQSLHQPWQTWLPSEWVTNLVYAESQHDLRGLAVNFGALLILAALLAAILYVLARRYYVRVWQEAVVASPPAGRKASGEWFFKLFPIPLRPFIRKDLVSFSRDTIERGSLLILLPLCAAYFYSIHILGVQLHSGLYDKLFSFFFIYLFSFFYSAVVIAGFGGRWVLPGVSLERNNFKLIKGSPAGLADFLRAKFLFGFVPLLVLGEGLALGAGLIIGYSPAALLVSLLVTLVFCWGLTIVPLILGTRGADFEIEESLDFIVGYNGLLALIYMCAFIGVVMILAGVPSLFYLARGWSWAFSAALAISLILLALIVFGLSRLYGSSLVKLAKKEV